ncbi:MAG: hypothetical protein IPM45_17700 [Acidimicrobiales bacterium]|nr:hypothetical protein [Acidimicrobiales bacterium]
MADGKAVYAYVPAIIRYYLGEEASSPTCRPIPPVGRRPAGRGAGASTSWW